MSKEIERRFELKALPDLTPYRRFQIQQGYLSNKPQTRIRRKVEVTGPNYGFPKGPAEVTLGVKFSTLEANTREEIEAPIPEPMFQQIYPRLEYKLSKYRFLIPAMTNSGRNDLTWELDLFQEGTCPNGYATVEIEVPDQAAFADLIFPEWIGEEISGVKEKSNLAIAGFDGGFKMVLKLPEKLPDSYVGEDGGNVSSPNAGEPAPTTKEQENA